MNKKSDEYSLKRNSGSINELLTDARYLRIQDTLKKPNIFKILSNATYEIRHSSFFAWLLDANESHNAGTLFSSRITPLLAPDAENCHQNWAVFREKDRIDILLVSDNETISIENKTLSKDSPGQLSRYRETIKRNYPDSTNNFFVYLTLHGDKPLDLEEEKYWNLCSYSQILEELKSILYLHDKSISEKAKMYINDYINIVEIYSTKNHQINIDAKAIVAEKKYNLMEVFNQLDDIRNLEKAQYEALMFIKYNSSFTKGNGFFRDEHFFFKAFKAALEKYNFLVDEEKSNSTYLNFMSKNMTSWSFAPEISKTVAMVFRFFEKTSSLQFGLGLIPETNENAALRNKIRHHIPLIQQEFGDNAVFSRGVRHIGLFSKKIQSGIAAW